MSFLFCVGNPIKYSAFRLERKHTNLVKKVSKFNFCNNEGDIGEVLINVHSAILRWTHRKCTVSVWFKAYIESHNHEGEYVTVRFLR